MDIARVPAVRRTVFQRFHRFQPRTRVTIRDVARAQFATIIAHWRSPPADVNYTHKTRHTMPQHSITPVYVFHTDRTYKSVH